MQINSRHPTRGFGGRFYHHFSPYNFPRSDWLAAAKRFIELHKEMVKADELSSQEHGHKMFVSCGICARSRELCGQYERFAHYFASWLLILLTGLRPLPLRAASISAALAKGPWTRPFLTSSNPSAKARSTMDLGVNTILPISAWASSKSPTRTKHVLGDGPPPDILRP
jgi:hypothetical protein